MRRTPLPSIGAILCGIMLIAAVQSPAVLANGRDAKFANGLVERGYYDLAEIEFERMVSASGASATQKRAGKLGLARVMMQAALRESDVEESIAKFKKAEAEFRAFISNREDSQYFLAAFQLGQLLQEKSSAIARIIEKGQVQEAGFESEDEIREEAALSLNDAQTLFDDLVIYLQSQTSLTVNQQTDLERAFYFQATNYYYVGGLYPKGTFERESNFKRSTEKLEDFIWEYESRPSALYAIMFKGKAHFEISIENDSEDDLNEALDSFAGAEVIGDKPDSLALLQDIYEWAIYESAVALNAWQKGIEAIEKVDSMLAAFEANGPRLKFGQRGFVAVLEKAKALQGLGDTDLALDTANFVADGAKGSTAGRLANELIKELLSGNSGTRGLSPKVLVAGGEAYFASREYLSATHKFSEALVAFEEQDETDRKPELASRAWNRLGDCLKKLGRNFESGLAFSAGRDRFQEPFDIFKDSAFRAYSSFQAFAKKLPENQRVPANVYTNEAKNFVLATFKDDVGDIIYFEAKDDFEENHYAASKEKFFRVDVTTRHYETSQLYIGRCDLEAGFALIKDKDGPIPRAAKSQIETGVKSLQDYRTWTKTYAAPDPARALTRKQALAASEYYESEAYWVLHDYDAMLARLDGFQSRWSDQKNLLPPAIYNRLRAYIAKKELNEASTWADYLYENYEKTGSTIQALAKIGQAYSDAEAEAEKAGDLAKAKEYRQISADFLFKWLQATGARFEQAVTVGSKFYKLENYSQAIGIFAATYNRYKDSPKYKGTSKLFNLKLYLGRSYLLTQKYHEAEPLFEEMLKERETLDLLAGVAKCYGGWVEEVDGKWIEFDGTARYPDALKVYQRFTGLHEPSSDTWWLGKFGELYMVYKAGQAEGSDKMLRNVAKALKNLKLIYTEPFGNPEIDKRIQWLDKQIRR